MAIQTRRGKYTDFDPDKMLPGEWGTTVSEDPTAEDGKAVYMCFAPGDTKRMATYEDMKENIQSASSDIVEQVKTEFTVELTEATEKAQVLIQESETAIAEMNQMKNQAEETIVNANAAKDRANEAAQKAEEVAAGDVSTKKVTFRTDDEPETDGDGNVEVLQYPVSPTQLGTMISWIIKKMKAIDLIQINLSKCPYRVGDVFTTTNAVNPSEYYKGTEWNVFAPGRVLVGVDSGQELFKTGGLEGGEQKVKLTESQIPSHTHIQNAHNHTQKAHGHAVRYKGFNIPSQVGGYAALRRNETADDYDGTDTNAAISATAVNNATTAVNQSTGGGQAHNNMQPYRTVYYFVRVK